MIHPPPVEIQSKMMLASVAPAPTCSTTSIPPCLPAKSGSAYLSTKVSRSSLLLLHGYIPWWTNYYYYLNKVASHILWWTIASHMYVIAGPGTATAKLVATKAKGLPLITLSLHPVAASALQDAIADFSLALYASYKTTQQHASRGDSCHLIFFFFACLSNTPTNFFRFHCNREILLFLFVSNPIHQFPLFCRTRAPVTTHGQSGIWKSRLYPSSPLKLLVATSASLCCLTNIVGLAKSSTISYLIYMFACQNAQQLSTCTPRLLENVKTVFACLKLDSRVFDAYKCFIFSYNIFDFMC